MTLQTNYQRLQDNLAYLKLKQCMLHLDETIELANTSLSSKFLFCSPKTVTCVDSDAPSLWNSFVQDIFSNTPALYNLNASLYKFDAYGYLFIK